MRDKFKNTNATFDHIKYLKRDIEQNGYKYPNDLWFNLWINAINKKSAKQ